MKTNDSRRAARGLRRVFAAAVAFAIVAGGASALASSVWVKTKYASVRDGKTSRSKVVAKAEQGQRLEVVRKETGFYLVKLSGGQQGWISRIFVSTKAPSRTNNDLEKLGEAARGGDGSDVTYTAGARGLSPLAAEYAESKDVEGAARALVRLEAVRITKAAIEAFMEKGRLGPYRGTQP